MYLNLSNVSNQIFHGFIYQIYFCIYIVICIVIIL